MHSPNSPDNHAAVLQAAVDKGHLLHGSYFNGASELIPHKSKLIRTNGLTGEPIIEPSQVCAITSVEYAIFFAVVRSASTQQNIWRGTGISGMPGSDLELPNFGANTWLGIGYSSQPAFYSRQPSLAG